MAPGRAARHHPPMHQDLPAPGPDLAKPGHMLDRMSLEHWRRALAAAVDRRWARSRVLLLVVIYGAWAGLCLALWRAGYPGWRVAVLAAALGAIVAAHASQALVRRCAHDLDDRVPFVLVLLSVAVTGGLHSPLLLGITGHLAGVVLRRGWTRETHWGLGAFCAFVIGLAVAPDPWFGPSIPEPTYTVTVVVVLLLTATVTVDYLAMVMRAGGDAVRQLLRVRDERADEALARAAELERMSSHLSHELKNPLGAIKALVQLSVRAERDPDIRVRLAVVEGEVERMQSILQGYLSFSRPVDALHPAPVALGPLADEVLAILEGRAEGAQVALRRSGDASIRGDPRRLKEALLNLVANGIEATAPGGEVEVRVARTDAAARVEVRDTGRGMPPDVLERVGTPFFTTRAAGTGLGVSLARGVVLHHGGTLEYASAPGRGTVATVTLPVTCREDREDGARAAGG